MKAYRAIDRGYLKTRLFRMRTARGTYVEGIRVTGDNVKAVGQYWQNLRVGPRGGLILRRSNKPDLPVKWGEWLYSELALPVARLATDYRFDLTFEEVGVPDYGWHYNIDFHRYEYYDETCSPVSISWDDLHKNRLPEQIDWEANNPHHMYFGPES